MKESNPILRRESIRETLQVVNLAFLQQVGEVIKEYLTQVTCWTHEPMHCSRCRTHLLLHSRVLTRQQRLDQCPQLLGPLGNVLLPLRGLRSDPHAAGGCTCLQGPAEDVAAGGEQPAGRMWQQGKGKQVAAARSDPLPSSLPGSNW